MSTAPRWARPHVSSRRGSLRHRASVRRSYAVHAVSESVVRTEIAAQPPPSAPPAHGRRGCTPSPGGTARRSSATPRRPSATTRDPRRARRAARALPSTSTIASSSRSVLSAVAEPNRNLALLLAELDETEQRPDPFERRRSAAPYLYSLNEIFSTGAALPTRAVAAGLVRSSGERVSSDSRTVVVPR